MEKIVKINTVSEYNRFWGLADRHPSVNVFEGSQIRRMMPHGLINTGLYMILLKDVICADYIKYGRQEYDYQENTLMFISPGQVFGHPDDGTKYQVKGWFLYFSPELLRGSSLGKHIRDYTFFSYETNEALHISPEEREAVIDCMRKIDAEIERDADHHSDTIITSAIELLLNYCSRFYDRQFATRKKVNRDILTRFERLLEDYIASDLPRRLGTPTVGWCASQLHLSANYFGDLVKKETGESAMEHIRRRLMEQAKDLLIQSERNINEIAYSLGYQYPQYFTRAFKKATGQTPSQYRKSL